jgi:hypothetical protein
MERKKALTRKKGMGAGLSNQVRREVYRRDGWRCALCDDTRNLQIHHAIPRAAGGSDFQENLITLCWRCHAAAHGTRVPELPEYCTEEYMEQAIVEYLSDWYAENAGEPWYPFK